MALVKQTYMERLAEVFLRGAEQNANSNLKGLGGILLGGEPGVGKTSFMELFSDLTGVKLITIEVPHIVEEHIINIPFLVYTPENEATKSGSTVLQDKNDQGTPQPEETNNQPKPVIGKDEYNMVLADSHLFTQLTSAGSEDDMTYLRKMSDPHPSTNRQAIAQQLFKALGGNETHIPPMISTVRKNFRCILFFDEYFRETTVRIRNVLREIAVNNNIGIHKVPPGTFIVYASNMADEGIEATLPKNTHMAQRINFKTPTKQEWFNWMEVKYKHDPHVQLKPEVVAAFKKMITDKNLSYDDSDSEVRTSPRRWEQLMIYVNQSLPVDNREDAVSLLTNVRNNFVNYETGEYSGVSQNVIKHLTELIKSTSSVDIEEGALTDSTYWMENLDHHIRQHMKAGNHRKYIPVIAGAPGVGKTSLIDQIAWKHKLIPIAIDTARLNSESVTGMPIPGKKYDNDSKIEIKFTEPELYNIIQRGVERGTKEYFEDLTDQYGEAEAQKRFNNWTQQQWKYLLFFDELNRPQDKKTFNALRRVVLEKNFGPAGNQHGDPLKLPDGSIVVGAINPDPDTGGTESMSKHFRDVVDVINATPAWSKTRKFIYEKPKGFSGETKDATMLVLDEIIKKFKDKSGKYSDELAPYYLKAGDESIWVSPREYDTMFVNIASALEHVRRKIMRDDELSEDDIREMVSQELEEYIESNLYQAVERTETVGIEEFFSALKQWIETKLTDKITKVLLSKVVESGHTWESILHPYVTQKTDVTSMVKDSEIMNLIKTTSQAQFAEGVSAYIAKLMKDEASFNKYLVDQPDDKVILDGKEIKRTGEKTSIVGNVLMGLLFTLFAYNIQYNTIAVIGKSWFTGTKQSLAKVSFADEIKRRDVIIAISELRTDIQDALMEVQNEAGTTA